MTAGQDGDARLAALLGEAGVDTAPDAVRALVAGVAASPLAADDESWIELVAPKAGAALRQGLQRLRTDIAAGNRTVRPPAAERLAALRAVLKARGVDGMVLPRADEHQGEYLPARAERLAWLTGFTGSAGFAVVLADRAAAFTDGRYTLQIRNEVDAGLYELRHVVDEPPADWIAEHLSRGGRLGFDPWLHTADGLARLEAAAGRAGGSMVPLDGNPIDEVWHGQPAAPVTPALPHADAHAGQPSAEKRAVVADALAKSGDDAAVLVAAESIAWLFNLRGADVPNTPLTLGFAVVRKTGEAELYIDERKLTAAARGHLGNAVAVRPRDALGAGLDALAAERLKVRVDPSGTPVWVARRIEAAGGTVTKGEDPVMLPRACKNAVELDGTRAAHVRDGAAFARFLHWLAAEAPSGRLDELAVAERLRTFRAEDPLFRGVSFETISGSGPNGAIVHYRATPQSNRRLGMNELYLCDSGAQYLDGTTDITRTVAIGEPGAEERDRFTRVLKGHIAIATVRFPKGTTGSQIDVLARHALWRAGLDFDHGTGHGVGSYLGVHEGPQRISKVGNTVAFRPGMLTSNEPGYYKTGAYGIRTENLIICRAEPMDGAEREMYGFETVTLAPIDRRLIDPAMLDADELAWLDAYHDRVRATLSPLLPPAVATWLAAETAPLG